MIELRVFYNMNDTPMTKLQILNVILIIIERRIEHGKSVY